jgi:hypothetical protein
MNHTSTLLLIDLECTCNDDPPLPMVMPNEKAPDLNAILCQQTFYGSGSG